MPLDFSKFSNDELISEYKKRQGGQQTVQQPGLTSDSNVNDLLFRAMGKKNNVGQIAGDVFTTLGGGNPSSKSNLSDDLTKTLLTQRVKDISEDPIDKALKRDYLEEKTKSLKSNQGLKTDQATLGRATQLRGELTKSPIFEKFRGLQGYSKNIDSVLSDTLNLPPGKSKAIGDQALVVLYNKMLDPDSVVRESEYARTPQGLSAMSRMQAFAEKVAVGGAGITDQERKDISRIAKTLLNATGEGYNQEIGRFEGLSDLYQVPRENVLTGFDRFNPYPIEDDSIQAPVQLQIARDMGQIGNQNQADPNQMRKQNLRAKYGYRQ